MRRFMLDCPSIKGGVVMVRIDDQDAYVLRGSVWCARYDPKGRLHVSRTLHGESVELQRYLMEAARGTTVHFIDGDPTNFCRNNLRIKNSQRKDADMVDQRIVTSGRKAKVAV